MEDQCPEHGRWCLISLAAVTGRCRQSHFSDEETDSERLVARAAQLGCGWAQLQVTTCLISSTWPFCDPADTRAPSPSCFSNDSVLGEKGETRMPSNEGGRERGGVGGTRGTGREMMGRQ